jgi:hypothetical protein
MNQILIEQFDGVKGGYPYIGRRGVGNTCGTGYGSPRALGDRVTIANAANGGARGTDKQGSW